MYTRRQELICTENQMIAKPSVVLRDGEVIRIRMNNGQIYEKMGDGVTPIIDLPYNINSKFAERAERAAGEAAENAREEVVRLVEELEVVQTLGHSPTAVVSQDTITTEFERIDGTVKMYASDFVSGYLIVGEGLAPSGTWIINPVGMPIKKGDKIKINPNGLVLSFMIESVPDLASVVTHLLHLSNISEEYEVVSNFDGYAFFQIRDAAWDSMSPEKYVCDITIGESNAEKTDAKIKALEEKFDSKCLSVSPKHKPFTRIIDDCQTASDWTFTKTNTELNNVDTTNFILGTQSFHCDKLMRCSKKSYDMVNNDLVVKIKINSIDTNARLHLRVAHTSNPNNNATYRLAMGHSAWTTPSDWYEIAIPYTAFVYGDGTDEMDFANINDIYLHSSEGNVDWNLQYIGLRPKKLKNGIVTFTFDDGYKSQYTGIKALAEKGITGTIFHIKKATEGNPDNALSVAELQELVNYYGADIEVHGDPSYDQWDETDLVAHWENSQKWLKENGLGEGKHMAYPNGIYPENVVQLAKRYFGSCRTITHYIPLETYPPADRYRMRAVSSVGENGSTGISTVDDVKRRIDDAVTSGAWLILVFHKIEDGHDGDAMYCSEASLKEIADYAINSGAYIMNYAEVFDSGII